MRRLLSSIATDTREASFSHERKRYSNNNKCIIYPMTKNKTAPTDLNIETFLASLGDIRKEEAKTLIEVMQEISGQPPVMWGPSIIGFGSKHYKYESGREGDTPQLGFSPRKVSITIYFNEGFHSHLDLMAKLGKYKASVSCLYINKLDDINVSVLRNMLLASYGNNTNPLSPPKTVEEYIKAIPEASRNQFDILRKIVKAEVPTAKEVLSYGIVGYKVDGRRARVFISGWKDHLAIYPMPKDEAMKAELAPYIKGKGTLWFPLDQPLPTKLIQKTIQALL